MPVIDPAGATTAMPAASVVKWTGLIRDMAPFAIAPGALNVADNVVIPGPSVLRPRRGFNRAMTFGATRLLALEFFNQKYALFTYNGTTNSLLAQNTTDETDTFTLTSGWLVDPTGISPALYSNLTLSPPTLSAFGLKVPVSTPPTRFFTANGNAYMGTNFGVLRVSATPTTFTTANPQIAGGTAPYPPALAKTGTTGFLGGTLFDPTNAPRGWQCAYRATLKYVDPAGNEHISPPSGRVLISNTGTTACDVTARTYIQDWVQGTYTMQLWRTKTVAIDATYPDVAGDEMFLVSESTQYLSANNTSYIYVDMTDRAPDVPWLTIPLYTNPTTGDVNGLGIGNANQPPPAAYDIFEFKNRTYYVNTEEVERLTLQIIGTGPGTAGVGGGGIQDGDQIIIGGYTFQARANGSSAVVGAVPYDLYYVGNPHTAFDLGSQQLNINATADSLARTIISVSQGLFSYSAFVATQGILADLSTHLTAINSSSPTGVPGTITIARFVPGAPRFTATAGTGAGRGWSGALASNNVSDSNRQPANLMQSQPDDPESVPPAFTNTIGSLDAPILRGVGLRDSAFVFKGLEDGLWKFTDDGTGTLTIGPLDQTVNCVAPESVVVLNNAAYALCDKGVLRITDGGSPENISYGRIQNDLQRLMQYVGPTTLARYAFGVAYEAERLYVLNLPVSPTSVGCNVQYVFNENTDAWTRWTINGTLCGRVNPYDGKLYLGRDTTTLGFANTALWVERKDLLDTDYQDEWDQYAVPGAGTYTASSLVFNGNDWRNFAVGDMISYVNAGVAYDLYVTAVTINAGATTTTLTLSGSATWVAGASFTYLKGIQANVELLPLVADEPLYEKQWQAMYFYFRRATSRQFQVAFSTEKQAVPQTHTLAGPTQYPFLWDQTLGFGQQAWGSAAKNAILRMPLDQAAARGAELTVGLSCGDAQTSWELTAIRIPFDPTTMRVVR